MDPLVVTLLGSLAGFGGLFGGLALFERRRVARRTADAYRVAARVAGLTDVEVSRGRLMDASSVLRARAGSVAVEITTRLHVGEKGQQSVITVGGLADLSLGKEGIRTSVSRQLGALEIQVGDPRFDDTLFVRGVERLVRAVLDAETRRLVLLLFEGRLEIPDQDSSRVFESEVEVKEGLLQVRARTVIASPRWLGETLVGLLDVARHLAQPADVPGCLAANARGDSIPTVRLANLRTLVAEYPRLPAALRSARDALDDPDGEVALWAATALGEEGRPVLRRVASDALAPEGTRARALRTLREHLPTDEGKEILSEALRARRIPVAQACLWALGEAGGSEVVDTLAKVLALERGPLAATAAEALGATEQEAAERPLVGALSRGDDGVALAAAVALGRLGSSSAVPSLRELESTTRDDNLRRMARGAVARIHARLTGATPGQLSLAGGESGQLSLTEDETGRVSLPDDEA